MITEQTRFRRYFGVDDIFADSMIMILTKKYSLDVIKFDKWLQDYHGYDIEIHGSTYDFIKLRFGDDALKFIKNVI